MENLLCIRQGTVSLKQIFVNSEERTARSLRGVSRCDPSGLKKAREEDSGEVPSAEGRAWQCPQGRERRRAEEVSCPRSRVRRRRFGS